MKINWNKILIYSFACLVLLFLILPTFIVIPISFSPSRFLEFPPPGFSLQWYKNFFSSDSWVNSFFFSLKVGFVTMISATILGTLASITLARSNSKWNSMLYYIMVTPMIVPLIIIAVAIYSLFIRTNLQGSFIGLVIAHTIIAIPYVITTVVGSLRGFDIRIEQAAISLGAHPFIAFMRVTVPIISPALISGALFAFIASFDELIVSIFVSGVFAKTLPVKMWEGIRLEIDPTIAAIASILITISVALFAAIELLKFISNRKGLS
ncbi:ABC transporter permease [Microaerobacter geothermalis]|uniref:ABC transporter permease n=1 Tax=Microaerobacter geothermalis TaxID=674972 RepID=UPI001F3AA9D2|nr:ABC transporter permease [Microaerobacter geothermalis]MCF6093678.1 ABC transporter permease [Microaerobacter geothermalis]